MGNKNSQIHQFGRRFIAERDTQFQKQLAKIRIIANQLQIDQKKKQKIIKSNAYELVEMLNRRQVSSKQLVVVYAQRSATVDKKLNLITQDNFQNALQLAQKNDQIRRATNKNNWTFENIDSQDKYSKYLPPLFGVPISVKDAFDQKGKRTTLGVTVRAHHILEKDCGLVTCLKDAGMIPFIRSNTSQTTFIFEASNYLFGRSLSLWDSTRNVGGSSGGEAGLISSLCSPIGLGNDIGGSVRIPALFNGLCSIKCSQQRIGISPEYSTYYAPILNGRDTFISVPGPLAKSVEDLALWLKFALDENFNNQIQPYKKLINFNKDTYLNHKNKQKLRIGYFKSYDIIQASAASQRAVVEVVQFLKQLGHQLIEIQIPNVQLIATEYIGQMAAEGRYRSLQQMLQGQQVSPSLKRASRIAKMPNVLLKPLLFVISKIFPRLYTFAQKSMQLSVSQYCHHKDIIYKIKKQFCNWWKQYSFDHIISPGFACQPNFHDKTGDVMPCALYTYIWNFLNFPAGVIPITTVKQQQQTYESRHRDLLTSTLKETIKGSAGLPVGIQVIGLPYNEEKILSVMKLIEGKFKFKQNLYRINGL